MKRLLTVLVMLSATLFALPTLAAPRILEKRMLTMPQLPLSIQRLLTTSAEWPKHPTEVNGPELTDERICSGITYRLWLMTARTVGENTTFQYGYIYQATRAGVSRWHIEQGASRPGLGPFQHSLTACANGGIAVARYSFGYAEPVPSNLRLGTVTSRTESKILPFDRFSSTVPWIIGRDSLTGWYKIDGVLQVNGTLTKANEDGVVNIKGDSRIFLIENGRIVVHRPPWYKNLQEMSLTPSQKLTAVYYKLSDGYGVAEQIFDGATVTNTLRYYRIRNGEASYRAVPDLPPPWVELVLRYNNGLELSTNTDRTLVHGLPPVCTSASSPCEKISAYGWIVKEDASKQYIHYVITKDGKPIQYWEAIIQK